MSSSSPLDVTHRFTFHPALTDAVRTKHEAVRAILLKTAEDVGVQCPDGREKALALTKLEEAMFWANAAIARHKDPER